MFRLRFVLPALLLLTIVYCGSCWAAWPAIASYPQVSASRLTANDSTSYSVVTTISDGDGYDNIVCIRVLFNFAEAGGDETRGRGYMAWGTADSEITQYGATWTTAAATGGGRWGYCTDKWGGTTYISPFGCTTTVSGSASGATGSRTVTFMFRAKPAWAMNPLINDADVWAKDASGQIRGWKENPGGEFDVVFAPCGNFSATPSAPVVSNPTPGSLDVAISPGDSDLDLYCIRVSPAVTPSKEFVQADGTLGGLAVFQSKAAWGTKTVVGLMSDTDYTFKLRANRTTMGYCPSGWSSTSSGRTAMLIRTIDYTKTGVAINKGIHGMNDLPWLISAQRRADDLAASMNTSIRYGGDGYNWKLRNGQWNCSTWSTLQALREARNRNSYLQILTNTRGIGTGNDSTFVYTDQTPETLAALTADWVFYVNSILQNRRQGDALTPREQAVLDSMTWGTDDKLLAPGEAPVPKVTYWEIGNEPEGPYPPPALTPTDYANRYKIISQAVLAEDPTIKVGPCMMSADNGNAWLDAVLSDPQNQVDFVNYHPYGPLYGATKTQSGGVLNADDLNASLNTVRQQQYDRRQKVVDRLVANARPADTPLVSSECNPSSWEGTYYYQLNRTVAHALGVPETIFAYADMGFLASQYWDGPNWGGSATIELPGFKMYKALQAYMGDRLLESFTEYDFRLYTTLDTRTGRLVIWALNLSEYRDKSARFQLPGDTSGLTVTQRRLAAVSGTTSLITKNNSGDASENVKWIETNLTGSLNPSDFTLGFPHSTATMIILDRPLMSVPDGTRISMTGKAVTAAYPSEGYLYLEQDDRTWGIRVEGSFSGIVPGDTATVAGTIGTKKPDSLTKSERVIAADSIVGSAGGGDIGPIAMNCRSVGGGATKYAVGVNNGYGLNNIGLLVTVAGQITQIMDDRHMLISDGSQSGGLVTDVLIECETTAGLSPGNVYTITGVVEGCVPAGWTTNRRFMRVRNMGDIRPAIEI